MRAESYRITTQLIAIGNKYVVECLSGGLLVIVVQPAQDRLGLQPCILNQRQRRPCRFNRRL